jgi:hypothetical protein
VVSYYGLRGASGGKVVEEARSHDLEEAGSALDAIDELLLECDQLRQVAKQPPR